MHTMTFSERAQALENEFFHRVDQELLNKLRQEVSEQEAKATLRAASGMADDTLLTELVRIGVRPETLAAMTLIPLVAVAWADGKLDEDEKRQVMAAERDAGVASDAPSHELLEQWLDGPPGDALLLAWQDYVHALHDQLKTPHTQLLGDHLLQRARSVAKASGGTLGYGSVSPSEDRVLKQLKNTLRAL